MERPLLTREQLDILRLNRLDHYSDIISCAIMTYDYMLTLGDEIEYIWSSPLSVTNILFFLTRYAPFVDTIIVVWQLVKPDVDADNCAFVYQTIGWLLLLGIMVAELILMLRTWAVYERKNSVGLFLVVWSGVTWIPNMACLVLFLRSLRYGPLPVQHLPGSGCHVVSGSSIVFACFALLMAFEAAILSLMVAKAVQNYRLARDSEVFMTVFRDGTVFYLYLFALSVANMAVILTARPGQADLYYLLSLPERMIHSVLTARIIINLRQLGSSRRSLGWSTFTGGIRGFATNVAAELEFAHPPDQSADSTELSYLGTCTLRDECTLTA